MANPAYIPITSTGSTQAVFSPDWLQSPFNLSYAVEVGAATTISYTVQYTLDDLNDAAWTPIWVADPTNGGTAQTDTQGGFYSFPIRGLRVTVTAVSGSNARFAVLQGMTS